MADVFPLAIWPHEISEERAQLLRRAKAELQLDFLIVPAPAVLGSPGRILAFGSVPDFYHDEVVLISAANVDRYESVLGALRYVLTAPPGSIGPASITGDAWLSAVFGAPVKYLGMTEYVPRKPGQPVIDVLPRGVSFR